MSNHMEAVAKYFGLKLGEKFKINNKLGWYRFTESGLVHFFPYRKDADPVIDDFFLKLLLTGEVSIQREFRPKFGDKYWYVNLVFVSGNIQVEFLQKPYACSMFDLLNQNIGNCFATKEEAEYLSGEICGKLKGRK